MIRTKKNYNILNDCRGMYEDEVFDTILQQRGVQDAKHFLNPIEEDLLPLDSLYRIDEAYIRINRAIEENENIGILFDTDTDGIAAGTIMTRYLRYFTDDIFTYIDDGKQHGLKGQNLQQFASLDLLIVVDSLDEDEIQYKELSEAGIDVLILDHHAIKREIPYDTYTILISSQRDYDNSQLSGAGVVWKFCKYLDEQFLTDYADELVDLAACGLVGDMMDMTVMENRYIVSKGLEKIYNPAVKKIVGGFEFNSTAIAFSIAPIVNAANRMGENETAMNAFLEDNNKQVLAYVKALKKCKEEQNQEVERLLPNVYEQCEKQKDQKVITVYIDTQYGIAGLLGNKLLEKYQKPILVLKDVGSKYAGSMRAVGVDDFRKICNDSGYAKADGHELASGIQIKKSDLNNFLSYVETNLPEFKEPAIDIDIQIDVEDITRRLVENIKKIDRISGTNFKPVRAYMDNICNYEIGQMSDYKHLVLKPNDYLQIIKWNFDGSFDDMEDHSTMNDEFEAVCSLDSGFLGRKFVLKAVCDVLSEVD